MGTPIGSDELRVGTAEREEAVRVLGEHFAEGRLGVDEYEERVSLALESKTRGDLRPLFQDLPAPYPAFMVPPMRSETPLPAFRQSAPAPVPYSDKSRIAAGALQVLLPFGVGRFYTGHIGIGLAQLLTSWLIIGVIWSIVDGILLLVNGGTDPYGRKLRD